MEDEGRRHAWLGFRFAEPDGALPGNTVCSIGADGGGRSTEMLAPEVRAYAANILRGVRGKVEAKSNGMRADRLPDGATALLQALGDGDTPPAGYLFCVDFGPSHALMTDIALEDPATAGHVLTALDRMIDILDAAYRKGWSR